MYQASFQIMNASARFVPKSQYNRIRACWRPCVIKLVIEPVASNANRREAPDAVDASDAPVAAAVPERLAEPTTPGVLTAVAIAEAAAGSPKPAAADAGRAMGKVDFTMLWLGAAMVVPWFGWRIA